MQHLKQLLEMLIMENIANGRLKTDILTSSNELFVNGETVIGSRDQSVCRPDNIEDYISFNIFSSWFNGSILRAKIKFMQT